MKEASRDQRACLNRYYETRNGRGATRSAQTIGLMKMRITGGVPQLVLTSPVSADPDFRCSRHPSALCILAEQAPDHTALVFTELDPMRGRGRERARFQIRSTPTPNMTGTCHRTEPGLRFSGSQRGQSPFCRWPTKSTQHLSVKAWPKLYSLDWSADGRALFVSALANRGSVLLHLGLNGHAQKLWFVKGGIREPGDLFDRPLVPSAVPSPDGRHLAIQSQSVSANIWLLENF